MTDVAGVRGRVSPALPRDTRVDAVPRTLTAVDALVVALGAAAWTAVVGWLALWRHNEFLSHRFDLGNMVQSVWSTTQGRPLEMTDGAEQITRLAAHADPALLFYVPLWWIHSGPEALLLGQAAALAAGLYPVVLLALKYTGSRLAAALLGCWYLAFPWVIWNAINDVHPVTLAIPLLLYAIWFLDEHHLGRFVFVAALALTCGELVGLTVAALGVWYALKHRRRRAGIAIAVAGTAWTAVCLLVLIPHFNDGRPSRYYSLFGSVGGSPRGLLETILTDPGKVLAQITPTSDGLYALLLLLPTAYLALGQPILLVVALPQLGVNVLSDVSATTQPEFQYVAPILPALIAATVMTVGRFHPRLRLLGAALPLAAALILLASRPPAPGEQEFIFARPDSDARTAAMREAIALVPADAPVAATNRLGAHLSDRERIYLFPERSKAEWATVDVRDSLSTYAFDFLVWLDRGSRFAERPGGNPLVQLDRDPAWRLVFDREDIRVYRRVS